MRHHARYAAVLLAAVVGGCSTAPKMTLQAGLWKLVTLKNAQTGPHIDVVEGCIPQVTVFNAITLTTLMKDDGATCKTTWLNGTAGGLAFRMDCGNTAHHQWWTEAAMMRRGLDDFYIEAHNHLLNGPRAGAVVEGGGFLTRTAPQCPPPPPPPALD